MLLPNEICFRDSLPVHETTASVMPECLFVPYAALIVCAYVIEIGICVSSVVHETTASVMRKRLSRTYAELSACASAK